MRRTLVAAVILTGWSFVNAGIINVPGDQPTVQAGIDASAEADTILVAAGTYVENISFPAHNIVLASHFLTTGDLSYIENTILDGGGIDEVVSILTAGDSTTELAGFTIRNGFGGLGAGIVCLYSNVYIHHNTITDNNAYTAAGIFCELSNATISDNTVSNNTSDRTAGGIAVKSGNPTISNNLIENNIVSDSYNWDDLGGGISLYDSDALIDGNTIIGNTAYRGAGIACQDGNPTITNNIISNNVGDATEMDDSRGGGIYINGSNAIIVGNTISGNVVDYGGGGILVNASANTIISNNIIRENIGNSNAGLYFKGSTSTVTDNLILGNSAYFLVAVVAYGQSNVELINNTFAENTSVSLPLASGGPLFGASGGSNLTFTNCILAFNIHGPWGGSSHFCDDSSTVTFNCSNIFGNLTPSGYPFDWVGCIADQLGQTGNFSANPGFCDAENGVYTLYDYSTCSPDNSSCGVLIGAGAVDCICVDSDGDFFGDAGHPENDCAVDNCADAYNPDQADTDGDGVGDACCCVNRGDVDHSGGDAPVDVIDLTLLVDYLFRNGPIPGCPSEGDVDGAGGIAPINVVDVITLVDYLFRGGPPPAGC